MTTDTITWGETYTLHVTAQDADGVPLAMDGTWQAACRITSKKLGGTTVVEELAMTLQDGAASHPLDTGEAPWAPGVYVYDIRLTDPDGHDFWSEPVRLEILNRNTPASA